MAILNDLLVKGCSRFLQQIYVNDDMSVSGTLVLSKIQDAAGTANNGPALIVGGTRTAAHLELDNNELMAKGSGTTTADLYINTDGGNVYLAKSGATTQIQGLLKVQGNSTFTGAATFNGNLTANGTTALKNVSISSDLTVTNNVKIEKTLTVEEEIRSPKWIIDNIANLGGEFVIAPTIVCGSNVSVVVAGPSSNQYTITVTDSSITSASFGGIAWSNGSVVKVSGTINGVVFVSVNGTMSQALNTTANTIQFKVSSNDVTLTAGTYTGDKIKNLHIMMYKVGGTVPVGIFMTSYGANKYPYIEIYSGTGTNTPTTRLGYLNGLPAISNISPSGWGLYTNNGFFSGTIVSTSGQIGGWTLGTSAIYHGTLGATNGYMLNASGNSSTTINGTSRSSLTLAIGSKFAVGNDGTLYANGANVTNINAGNISAGSISVDRIKANVISAVNNGTGTIDANKINVSEITIGQSQVTNLSSALSAKSDKTIPDTRNDNQPPSWYFTNYPRQTITEFKYANKIGIGTSAVYCSLITVVPWNDSSGGYPVQTVQLGTTKYHRVGTAASTWGAWTTEETTAGAQSKADAAAKTANNYISADSNGIRIASASPASQNQRLHLTNATADFYSSDNQKRLSINSSTGVTVGRSDKGHVLINDTGMMVYDTSNKVRTVVDASGLDVRDTDGTTSIANFGSITRIGKTSASHLTLGSSDIEFLDGSSANLLGIDSNGTFKFGQVESGVPYITMQGTSGPDPFYPDITRETFKISTGGRDRTNNQSIALRSTRKWSSGNYYDYAGLNVDITQGGAASASLYSATTGGTDNSGEIAIKSDSNKTKFYGRFTEAEIQDGELGTIRGVFPTHGVVNWGQGTGTPANSYLDFTVDFDHTYSAAPHVIVGFYSTSTAPAFGGLSCAVNSITQTGCTIRIFNSTSTARSPAVEWIAIG